MSKKNKIHFPDLIIDPHDPFLSERKKPKKSTGEIRRQKKYKLDQLLRKSNVTLGDIHTATGISYQALAAIKNGTIKGRIRTMRDIANYLNVDVKDII